MLSSNQPNHSNNESPPYNDNCRTSSITGDRSSHKSKKSKFQKKIITGRNSSTKAVNKDFHFFYLIYYTLEYLTY